jgi:hypothetical protein
MPKHRRPDERYRKSGTRRGDDAPPRPQFRRSELPPFASLTFGRAAAERESAEDPELLLSGYLDVHSAADRILHDSEFLVLGYKGSGKSAISHHLKLRAQEEHSLFAQSIYLADFPYAEFADIQHETGDGYARYPAVWTWILALYILTSFSTDEGALSGTAPDFLSLIKQLRRQGFIPSTTVPQLLRKTKTSTFSVQGGGIATASVSESEAPGTFTLPPVIDRVLEIISDFESDSDHLIIVDGLDDVLLGAPIQTAALSTLVLAISRLNRNLAQAGACAKVVLLCRTDLYESLPLPNKNKIRQDSAIVLDWYQDTNKPRNTELVRLTNLKARVHAPELPDIFAAYFPEELRGRSVLRYLLDFTRHTPRDLLRLLKYIQEFSEGNKQLGDGQIHSGIRKYSIDYFLPEISDELEGFLKKPQVNMGLDLVSSFNQQHFDLEGLRRYASGDDRFKNLNLEQFLERMFEASAVGNVRREGSSKDYFTFKYRNRHSSINFEAEMRVHQGLWQGLGLTARKGSRSAVSGSGATEDV